MKIFRPRSNIAWAIVALTIDAFFIAQLALYPTTGQNVLVDVSVAVALGALACLLWIRPKLILGETELVVINPIKRVTIAYGDITDLETKWSLLIVHKNGRTRVWVAPANGKYRWISGAVSSWGSSRIPNTKAEIGESSMSQSLSSDSGIAAALIRERLRDLH